MEEKINRKKVRLLVRKFGGGDSNSVQSNLSVKNCINVSFPRGLVGCTHWLVHILSRCSRWVQSLAPKLVGVVFENYRHRWHFFKFSQFFWRAGFKNISKILSEKSPKGCLPSAAPSMPSLALRWISRKWAWIGSSTISRTERDENQWLINEINWRELGTLADILLSYETEDVSVTPVVNDSGGGGVGFEIEAGSVRSFCRPSCDWTFENCFGDAKSRTALRCLPLFVTCALTVRFGKVCVCEWERECVSVRVCMCACVCVSAWVRERERLRGGDEGDTECLNREAQR